MWGAGGVSWKGRKARAQGTPSRKRLSQGPRTRRATQLEPPPWPATGWLKCRQPTAQVCGQVFTGPREVCGLNTGDRAVSKANKVPDSGDQPAGQNSCQRSSQK